MKRLLLAHSEYDYANQSAPWLAQLTERWYTALPLFILVVLAAGAVSYLLFRRSLAVAYFTVAGLLLAGGMLLYTRSSGL